MGRPNQLHDRLDALLDGRPGEVTDDLAPLLAAAEAMRAELADIELDPEVVDRHLEQVLDRPATVVTLPVRTGSGGALRRRVAAAALAAALLLVPATAASAASASALPGQALYPVKRAVEEFRVAAVQWSAAREAHERTRLAATRLRELDKLVQRQMFEQVPRAIRRLDKAVVAAAAAVNEAAEGGAGSEMAAVVKKLGEVQEAQVGELVALRRMVRLLPTASRQEIVAAVEDSPAIDQLPLVTPTTTPTTPTNPPTTPPATEPQPPTTPPATEPPPTTTTPPPSEPPTTDPPPTEPPTTTAAPAEGSPAEVGFDSGTPSSTTVPS
jgi:hypothetical protein